MQQVTLIQWRAGNRYSRPAFLKLLLNEGLKISVQTLYNWETGRFLPNIAEAEIIRKATGGTVLPESFVRQGG